MNDDQMREFLEYLNSQRDKVRYCQRCEEPRSGAEFLPGPVGVCAYCLKTMQPGELKWLKQDVRSKFGE